MFSLRYLILEESKMSLIENDDFEILGQIEIIYGNKKQHGIIPDIPMLNEYLFQWFIILNKVCNELKNSRQVAYYRPESPGIWVNFQSEGDNLIINEYKTDQYPKGLEFVRIEPLSNVKINWSNEIISKQDFFKEINQTTRKFLDELTIINSNINSFNEYKELEKLSKINY